MEPGVARPAEIMGDLVAQTDNGISGWCWFPRRPLERPIVDISVDAMVVISIVASAHREDLKVKLKTDGKHGFRVGPDRLPVAGKEGSLISASEQSTGVVFARTLLPPAQMPASFRARLESAASECLSLRRHIGLEFAVARDAMAPLSAAFRSIGATLVSRALAPTSSEGLVLAERSRLMQKIRTTQLVLDSEQEATVILFSKGDAQKTAELVQRNRDKLRAAHAGIVLIDEGADPRMPLLATIFEELSYAGRIKNESFVEMVHQVALSSKGGVIFYNEDEFSEADINLVGPFDLLIPNDILAIMQALNRNLAARVGRLSDSSTYCPCMMIKPDLYRSLGGLDAEVVCLSNSLADLALKAVSANFIVLAHEQSNRFPLPSRRAMDTVLEQRWHSINSDDTFE